MLCEERDREPAFCDSTYVTSYGDFFNGSIGGTAEVGELFDE